MRPKNNNMNATDIAQFLSNFDEYRDDTVNAKYNLMLYVDPECYSEDDIDEYIKDLCNRASLMYSKNPSLRNLFCLTMAISTLKAAETCEVDSEYSLALLADKIKNHKYEPTPMERFQKWSEYCKQWNEMIRNNTTNPNGFELPQEEYEYYKKHGYPLEEIKAWCKK